jgi:hypothetical protein
MLEVVTHDRTETVMQYDELCTLYTSVINMVHQEFIRVEVHYLLHAS